MVELALDFKATSFSRQTNLGGLTTRKTLYRIAAGARDRMILHEPALAVLRPGAAWKSSRHRRGRWNALRYHLPRTPVVLLIWPFVLAGASVSPPRRQRPAIRPRRVTTEPPSRPRAPQTDDAKSH